MLSGYKDITSRIKEQPKWWDQNGVPRYDEFHPDYCPNIYTQEVVLLRISCQNCNEQFDVEMHAGFFSPIGHPHKLHYGDPPNHGCIGDSMNCIDLAVLQVWIKENHFDWVRKSEFEGVIDDK